MEWVKTTAKTLPEAIDLALDNLGVDESEAEIVVLEEPRPGLFGRMRGTARVEARVKPKAIRPKTERTRGRRNRSEGGGRGKGDRNRNKNRNRSGGNRSGGQGRGRGGDGRRGDGERAKGSDAKRDQQQPRDRGDGGGGGQRKGRDRSADRGPGRSKTSEQTSKPKEDTPVEEVAAHLESFLTGLTEAFGFESEVTIDSSEQDVLVGRIEGQHGLLVGPKGRTLDAVQELARISCQRTVPSSVRIKVDVGGYRQQRVEALGAFAAKAADKAVADGVEVALEPMSPADRKAVHDALGEDERVETRSVGAEPRRKVLVVPVVESSDEDAEDGGEPEEEVVDGSNGATAETADDGMVDAGADE